MNSKEIKLKYNHYYTVGELLEFIKNNNIPNDAKILLQRIDDVYFNEHNWKTVNKEGYNCYEQKDYFNKLKSGYFWNKEIFPDNKPEDFKMLTEEENNEIVEQLKERYYPCWCPVKYSNDDNLYLDAHY